MDLIFQILVIFVFVIIFYTIIIISIISVSNTEIIRNINNTGNMVRFKNLATGKYLSKKDRQFPELIESENSKDPATLFRLIYKESHTSLQSVYNNRFLAVIDDEVTSVSEYKPEETWFSLDFNKTVRIIPFSGGFLSASTSSDEVIIIDKPCKSDHINLNGDNSQWILERVTSFLI